MNTFNNFLSPRVMVGAAIVGIVGAAGVFIYEQVYAEKRRAMLVSEVARLDKQVSTMRAELEAIRELQKETQMRRAKHKARVRRSAGVGAAPGAGAAPAGDAPLADLPDASYASDSEYFTDYQSVIGTDGEMDSEEFYDVHTDDEDDTLREPLRNGHAPDLLEQDPVDKDKPDPSKSSLRNST